MNTPQELIEDIRAGKMVILVDDESRENEGDLVIAADHVNALSINFMAKEARGLICLALESEQIDRLGLRLMVDEGRNHSPNQTAFTVSIEAAQGVTTGISAADRAHTIRVAANPLATAKDIITPGHIFPIRAQKGGVLKRAGHTEGSVDLAKLAGLNAAAVICEIMNEDGSMARVSDLQEFAKAHDLKMGTIESLIQYRIDTESFVEEVAQGPLTSEYGEGFQVHVFRNLLDGREHLALVKGDVAAVDTPLVRVHRQNVLGDLFGLQGAKSQHKIEAALSAISKEGQGVLLYLRNQDLDNGLVEAVKALGEPPEEAKPSVDQKDYGVGAQILRSLGIHKLRLLTNSPVPRVGIKGYGLEIVSSVPLAEVQEDDAGKQDGKWLN